MILEFRIDTDNNALEEKLKEREFNPGVDVTWFMFPTKIIADGKNLLAHGTTEQDQWRETPLLATVDVFRRTVEELKSHSKVEHAVLEYWTMEFERIDDNVRITSQGYGSATIPRVEFESAVHSFIKQAREFLIANAPFMQHHPDWSTWFGGIK